MTKQIILNAVEVLRHGYIQAFLPQAQLLALRQFVRGEEGEWFAETILKYEERIQTMPVTYEQDGKGEEAVAHLRYFGGSATLWITEKDKEDGVSQAFGKVDLYGHGPQEAELGYISITEIVEAGMELDLHFEPTMLKDLK